MNDFRSPKTVQERFLAATGASAAFGHAGLPMLPDDDLSGIFTLGAKMKGFGFAASSPKDVLKGHVILGEAKVLQANHFPATVTLMHISDPETASWKEIHSFGPEPVRYPPRGFSRLGELGTPCVCKFEDELAETVDILTTFAAATDPADDASRSTKFAGQMKKWNFGGLRKMPLPGPVEIVDPTVSDDTEADAGLGNLSASGLGRLLLKSEQISEDTFLRMVFVSEIGTAEPEPDSDALGDLDAGRLGALFLGSRGQRLQQD